MMLFEILLPTPNTFWWVARIFWWLQRNGLNIYV